MKIQKPVSSSEKIDKKTACAKCLRPQQSCICDRVTPITTHTRILILQHPQEQYKLLNSAMLSQLSLVNSTLRVGLSWRNLAHALGEKVDAKDWGVLYLKGIVDPTRVIELFDTKNRLLPLKTQFAGIVVLDGSWKQAKAMWWRNSWLLKLARITLNPEHQSLRGQAKKEGLATIEAIAMVMDCLGEDADIGKTLRGEFEELIVKPLFLPIQL